MSAPEAETTEGSKRQLEDKYSKSQKPGNTENTEKQL